VNFHEIKDLDLFTGFSVNTGNNKVSADLFYIVQQLWILICVKLIVCGGGDTMVITEVSPWENE
jgi:hypothetical protein